jgi:RNA polymerase sigma-70 factor (ECF subfamily)
MSRTKSTDSGKSEFHTRISLIARVRDRADNESWGQFYQFYEPLLMRYVRSLGLKDHAANDLVQDVFIRLLRTLPGFQLYQKRGRFRSYLWKLTHSALVDQARRVKVRRNAEQEWVRRFLSDDGSESRKLHRELEKLHRQRILEKALECVRSVTPSKVWRCFEQRMLRNRPASTIAAEVGISANTVFIYASRVLKAIRKECAALAEELEDEPIDWLPGGA